MLSGSDTENSPLEFAITTNGHLGSAGFDNASTGRFTYTGRAGDDHFTFTVNDSDKTSAPAGVNAHVISTGEACAGPEAPGYDTDGDGYADLVELAFSTDINDKASTPAGLNPDDFGISFTDDDDSDGFSDLAEIWLGTNPHDADSIPTSSLTKGLPACVSGGTDHVAPSPLAFDILTPVVTISGTTDVASFSITAADNNSGVKNVKVLLRSPSGQEIKAVITKDPAPLMLYQNFNSDAFSYYAEAGIWKVAELELTDGAGTVRLLGTADLVEREFPVDVQVINPNSDIAAATLLDFTILTPTLDLAGAPLPASFNVQASDSPAGIRKVSVTLQSPSGKQFRWGEMFDTNHPTSINVQIDTNDFDTYAEIGTWKVSELALIDEAGNALRLTTAQIAALGFGTDVVIGNGLLDSDAPLLDDFQILTPKVYPAGGDAKAEYSVTTSDAKSGVHTIEVMLVSPSGNQSMKASITSADNPSPLCRLWRPHHHR
jgi:hypothetical protein